MKQSAKNLLIGVYRALRVQQEAIHETFCATNALVKAIRDYDPSLADLFQRHHLKVVSDTVKKQTQALQDIDDLISALKEMPE